MREMQSSRWLALLLIAVMLVQLIVGCGGGQTTSRHQYQETMLDQTGRVDFIAQQGDGDDPLMTKTDGSSITIEELKKIAADSAKNQAEITFVVNDRGDNVPASRVGFQVGVYYCRIQWHKGWIGGCIKRNAWHFNLEIKRNDIKPENILVNLHLVAWWDNGPQFGVYNPVSDFCKSTEGKFTAIKEIIKEALMEIGVAESTSSIIASITAVVVFYGMYVIISGVAVALAAPPDDENNDDITPPPNEGVNGPPDFPDIPPDNNGGNDDNNDGGDQNGDNQGGPPDFPDIPPDNPGGNDGGNDQTDRVPPVIERENSRVEFLP